MLTTLRNIETQFADALDDLRALIATLEDGDPVAPTHTDIRASLPVNPSPDEAWMRANNIKDWWVRTPEQITGITIHHMASTTTAANIAAYITRPRAQGGKGLPRTQYHWQVDADGKVWYCLDEMYGCWHDNCGHQNKHIAIVMNGALHIRRPTDIALTTTATLVRYLMHVYNIPLDMVRGHNEAAIVCTGKSVTACPGWNNANWKTDFYAELGQPSAQAAPKQLNLLSYIYGILTTSNKQELDSLKR